MRFLREESGQVLVMTLVCMGILFGALGLAVDTGLLFQARRNMQTAADAAAMAGATEMYYNGATNVTAMADAAAKANGVDNTVTGNAVIVTTSPTLPGGYACASCVQVQLAKPNPTVFMQMLSRLMFASSNYSSINVSAMAVAGAPGASQTCMYVMDPTDPDTLWIHGAGDINAPGCAVYVNSDSDSALCVTGNAGKSTFSVLYDHGGQDSAGNCKGDPGPPVDTHAGVQTPAVANQGLPSDPTVNCTTGSGGNTVDLSASSGVLSGTTTGSTGSYGPGYGNYMCFTYTGGCTTKKGVTTCSPVTLSGATLGPGIYVFESGVSVGGNTTVGKGNNSKTNPKTLPNGGASIVVTGTGAFDSSTASNFSIWAPADSTSAYNAVAIYQPYSDNSAMTLQFGSSSSFFMGAVYAPSAAVTLHDQGGAVNATDLIVGSIYVNGTVNLSNYSTYNPITTPFKQITLVE